MSSKAIKSQIHKGDSLLQQKLVMPNFQTLHKVLKSSFPIRCPHREAPENNIHRIQEVEISSQTEENAQEEQESNHTYLQKLGN